MIFSILYILVFIGVAIWIVRELRKYKYFLAIVVFFLLIVVLVFMLQQMGERMRDDCTKQNFSGIKHYWDADIDCSHYLPDYYDPTYEKCCGGSFCTDTYFDEKNNRCVLSLCESSLLSIFNKSQCYYPPT